MARRYGRNVISLCDNPDCIVAYGKVRCGSVWDYKEEDMENIYMTAREVSVYLNIHLQTVYRKAKKEGAERLPSVRIGGSIRFNKDAIYKWMQENSKKS